DEAAIAAARARADRARTILPENPTVDVLIAARRNPTSRDYVLNAYGTVRQPLEIAGQRRARKRVAAADVEATQADAKTSRRRIAANAVAAYYDALAATRRLAVIDGVVAIAASLEELARERESAGVASGLQYDLAHAAHVEASARRISAQADRDAARAELASMLGRASVEVTGELAPIDGEQAHGKRPELAASRARIDEQDRTRKVLKRERVPNPSLVFTVQRDGFSELVLGGGISLGIPLPSPLGRTPKAAIAETTANARRARAELDAQGRAITREQTLARAQWQARKDALALYDDATITRAEESLKSLREAITAGTVDLRDAMLAQRTLLELLEGRVAAEHELAIASIDLAHANGRDLEALR
ncbi:MAG TPA: TolC family protein, partial [Nannocystaceae bacterium]|nr:TolC family protein [Nannocystaceae bacterium]